MKASGKSYSDLVIFSLSIFEVSIESLIQGLRVICTVAQSVGPIEVGYVSLRNV